MGVEVVTFGCRLNAAESETMRARAEAAGHRDVLVVNTCAVTAEATRQARQAIRKLARERPQARIVVTGCAAQIEPQEFAALPGVAEVLGNHEKLQAESWSRMGPGTLGETRVADIMTARETAPPFLGGMRGRTRVFVPVQNGCDHRCTFCIIPFGRGNSRSVPMGAVVDQVATSSSTAPRGGAHRRGPHELRGGPARRAEARDLGQGHPAPRPGAAAPAPVLHRFD
jgi:threonylcarbamoyladenosine tRNA methylthiotransferase MtaB